MGGTTWPPSSHREAEALGGGHTALKITCQNRALETRTILVTSVTPAHLVKRKKCERERKAAWPARLGGLERPPTHPEVGGLVPCQGPRQRERREHAARQRWELPHHTHCLVAGSPRGHGTRDGPGWVAGSTRGSRDEKQVSWQ